jgi:hypothetical protein
MQFNKLKSLIPHAVAVVTFIVLSAVYFYPQLEGFRIRQGDTQQGIGMTREIADFRAKYGTEPLWTGAGFSGMPTYQISTKHVDYVPTIIAFLIFKPFSSPMGYIILAMIMFYILLICFDVNPWLSIIGAVAFGFASQNILLLEAGHNSKVHAIALLPLVIGSLLLAYRKNYITGAILLSFSLCLEVAANHLQMTYYGTFLIGLIVLVELYIHLKNKLLLKFLKISGVLVVAVVIGLLPSFSNLYTTYEYGKYSTRGKSELTISPSGTESVKQTTTNALEPWYITQYDMSVGETWSVVIPNVKGGTANYMSSNKVAMEKVDQQFKEPVGQQSTYWGEQYFSGGAIYFGATIFVLFILGLVFIKDPVKWAFLGATVLAVVLSWKYGSILSFFIDHFPLFNKFRDTKGMLIIAQISLPFVGLLFLKEIFNRSIDKKKLLYALLAINGLLLLFLALPATFFDFITNQESNGFSKQIAQNPQYTDQINIFISELEKARITIFRLDTMRSLLFALLMSGFVFAFVAGKIKKNYFLISVGFLVLIDLWAVDKRYLNNEESGSGYKSWVDKQQYSNPYRASAADSAILNNELAQNPALRQKIDEAVKQDLTKVDPKDNIDVQKERLTFSELGFSTNYRVLTLPDPFSNGEVSYFHKSLGGYNGAKLKKYQELIDFYIGPEINAFYSSLRDSTITMQKIDYELRYKMPVLNLLNTKYIIYSPSAAPFINPNGNGNAWFAREVKYADNDNDEMLSLGKIDLKTTAVINAKYKAEVQPFQFDSTATIKQTSYKTNDLMYEYKSGKPQLLVFSEIYYPKGWDAFIDGKKTTYFSANYLLRALSVPAGTHTIEFKFEPRSYQVGENIARASSVILLLLLFGAVSVGIYKKVKE